MPRQRVSSTATTTILLGAGSLRRLLFRLRSTGPTLSTEIIESISPEDLQPTVKICVDSLSSSFVALKRSAAAKLRLLAKNRSENRALIGTEVSKQNAACALLSLVMIDENKVSIGACGAIPPLVVSSSLAAVEEGKTTIVEEGGITALVEVIEDSASMKGKEFAVVTLLQLCEGVNNGGGDGGGGSGINTLTWHATSAKKSN